LTAIYQSVGRLPLYGGDTAKVQGGAMWRSGFVGLASILVSNFASAQPLSLTAPDPDDEAPRVVAAAQHQQAQSNLGGGFIEFLFGNGAPPPGRNSQQWYGPPPEQSDRGFGSTAVDPRVDQRYDGRMDPRFLRQAVAYDGKQAPGTVVIDTPNHFLYLVEGEGRAIRYGIGVGRPGFTWSGVHAISAKKEWPDWTPPDEMIKRQPYLPHFVAGGPNNPLGARALYLGSTLYRIHGSNEPWTIGQNVSSGCIRMRNADVIDLYERVKVGTKVVVL
jgi:lipoprotein-anchoring transpeptidase ErfK/SrfK